MSNKEKVLHTAITELGSYQVVDLVYEGRKARVLFSGNREAAFSGMPLDGEHDLLFDYIQRLFELVAFIRPERLLLIGGGTYTLPSALLIALPDIKIDVVEINRAMDDIARRFFGYQPSSRLEIFHQDGKEFLKNTDRMYDMVIIDAFTHLSIPTELSGNATAKLIHARLSKRGLMAINIISAYLGRASAAIAAHEDVYKPLYKKIFVYPADNEISLWSSQNFIMIAEKGKRRGGHGLKYAPVHNTGQI